MVGSFPEIAQDIGAGAIGVREEAEARRIASA